MLILAESSAEALDVVFQHMIIDPASRQREYITKHRVISDLHIAYRRAEVSHLVQSRVSLFVGDRVNSDVDFAVTRGHVYQLCQGWSFQRTGTGIDDLSSQVKAWGYALRSLRDGEPARVFGSHDQIARVDRDVDLQILFAPPRTREQQDVFEEARQVFSELRASVHALNEADMIGARAAELVA
jgi:hypothetical protein